jgi:hypothetical protein
MPKVWNIKKAKTAKPSMPRVDGLERIFLVES